MYGQPLNHIEEAAVGLLLRGIGEKEIAATLHRTRSTIKNTLSHAYRKLGVSSGLELIVEANKQQALHLWDPEAREFLPSDVKPPAPPKPPPPLAPLPPELKRPEWCKRFCVRPSYSEIRLISAFLSSPDLTNDQIGARIGMTPNSVRNSFSFIYGKAGVRSRAGLAVFLLKP